MAAAGRRRDWARRQARFLLALGVLCFLGVVALVVAAFGLRSDEPDGDANVTVEASVDPPASSTGNEEVPATTAGVSSSSSAATSSTSTSTTSSTTTSSTTVPLAAADGKTSSERRLVDAFTVTDADLQPKSIVASGDGLFFAQNMMYRHNVMVFDRAGKMVAKIPDAVDLAAYGIADGPRVQGSPVEAAFTPDGSSVFVSNYKMYGPGYNPVADDNCNRGHWDDSFVYRIDTSTFAIDAVIPTGAVPKFMAVTPDGGRLLVSNWCGFDVSVIDVATNTPITRIDVGRHPRGIAIADDSRYAYIAVMGEAKIVVIDLASNSVVGSVPNAGQTPRHLVLSPDDRYLYVSNNHGNQVRKIELSSGAVVGTASTGTEPRSMAISDDGESLYVVNYQDGTVSKVRTSDMEILQTEYSGVHPVGITYDAATRQVWVANYTGSLHVFLDT